MVVGTKSPNGRQVTKHLTFRSLAEAEEAWAALSKVTDQGDRGTPPPVHHADCPNQDSRYAEH